MGIKQSIYLVLTISMVTAVTVFLGFGCGDPHEHREPIVDSTTHKTENKNKKKDAPDSSSETDTMVIDNQTEPVGTLSVGGLVSLGEINSLYSSVRGQSAAFVPRRISKDLKLSEVVYLVHQLKAGETYSTLYRHKLANHGQLSPHEDQDVFYYTQGFIGEPEIFAHLMVPTHLPTSDAGVEFSSFLPYSFESENLSASFLQIGVAPNYISPLMNLEHYDSQSQLFTGEINFEGISLKADIQFLKINNSQLGFEISVVDSSDRARSERILLIYQ